MAKRNRKRRDPGVKAVARTLHCNCGCPYWDVPHDHVWRVRCDCGREEYACGHCLEAGRVTCCLACGVESN